VVLLSARTALRNFEYRNPIAMYKRFTIYNPTYARNFANLGRLLSDAGRLEDAARALDACLELEPDNVEALGLYGNTSYRLGRYEKATELYRRGLALRPGDVRLASSIARSEMLRARYAEAVFAARTALKIDPSSADTKELLAWLLATAPDDSVRSGKEALALLAEIPENPHYPSVRLRMTRAAALAEAGRYDDAIAALASAIQLAQKTTSPLLKELSAQLQRYQARQPWRLAAPEGSLPLPDAAPQAAPAATTPTRSEFGSLEAAI
jgi:tetratricopeptide (TPR) repeat protein